MRGTPDAASAVIFLSAIGLLAAAVIALAAFVETSHREGRMRPRKLTARLESHPEASLAVL
jgi:hypothetical protein